MNVREALDNIYKEFEKSYEEAVNEGYKTGLEEGYKNGANDVWECVNKIYSKIDQTVIESIFGVKFYDVFEKFTASEAMAKVKEYEEKQKEPVFKIGDRVEIMEGHDITGLSAERVGTIGEVIEVDCDGDYLVRAYGEHSVPYYYRADTLEPANDVILVGDEVWLLDKDYHGVITAVWEDCGVVKTERLTQSGKLACDDAKDLHRTGRRFPEIANILKQMQEGEV